MRGYSTVLRRAGGRGGLARVLVVLVIALGALLLVSASAPAGSGLIAAYSFDEGLGATAGDASGNGNTGSVVGGTWVQGKFGSAINLNGTSDHVDLPALGTFYKTGFTFEAWVKKASTSHVDAAVVGTWTSNGSGGPMIWVDHVAGHYYLTANQGFSNYLDSGQTPTAGTWQYLTGTFDGTTASFYINGLLVASRTFTGNVGDSNTWRIGSYGSSPGGFFDGAVDQVRIYDHALTQAQVQTDMNTPVGPVDSGPPTQPTALTQTASTSTSVSVGWTASTDDVGVTAYDVFQNGTKIGSTTSTSYTLTGLDCGTTYTIAVAARDAAGNSSTQATASATTSACGSNQGLVAAYSFDEGAGTVLNDNSGNGNNGTIVGGTWTSGRFRSALHFNGTSDRVDLPPLGTFYKNAFTIEAWVKKDTSTKSDVAVVGTWASGQGGPMLWIDYVSSHLDLTLNSGGSNYVDSGQLLTAGQWQYLTGTYDGTTAKVYINGVLVASKAFSGNVGDSNSWRIGSYGSSPTGFFDGTIDEVRIYNRALAPSEVTTDMNRSVGTPDTTAPTTPTQFVSTGTAQSTVATSWTASTDNVAVSGYNLYVNGAKVDTTTSTSYTFTGLTCGVSYTLGVAAFDAAGNVSTPATLPVTTVSCDTSPPSVSITSPTAGASLSGVISVNANASDNVGVVGVQFKLDGSNLGSEDTTTPYTVPWDTRTAPNGPHTLTAVARDGSGNTTTSTAISVSVTNSMPFVPGLVASYALDDGSGSTATDSSGAGHPGTVVGGTWVPGKYGAALLLNGTSDRVDLPPLGTFYKTGFTLEAWVNKTNALRVDTGVVGTWSSDANGGPMIWVDHVSGHYYLTLNQGLGNYLDSGVVPSAGNWTHLAATYDGTTAKFYVNGVLAASKPFSGNVGDSNSWRIGAYGSSPTGFFDGSVDDVRIYNLALTQAQVQTDMATPAGPVDTTPPTAPTNFAVTSTTPATITTSWTAATDNVAVTAYNLYRNGTRVATIPAPATSYTFDSLACGQTYTLQVEAADGAGNLSARTPLTASTAACDTTPPTVSVTSPTGGSTLTGSVTISANASDDTAVSEVSFWVDGQQVGTVDNAPPYTTSWDTRTASNGTHTITAIARDSSNNTTTSAPVTVTVNNVQAPPPPGLVAAYSFDQGSGTTVTDQSGHGNTGTLTNVTWSPNGVFGSAASFNGTNGSFVTVPDSNSLDLTNGMTLEAWVKPTSLSGWNTVVFKEQSNSYDYALYANTGSNQPSGNLQSSLGDNDLRGTSQLPLNTWTHLAATYDGTVLTLYVNGQQVGTKLTSGPITTSNGALRIGGNTIWNEPFSGLIDEVRVYNQPLTQSQILTDMNSSISVPDTSPPSAPGTLTATGGLGSASLNWGAATDNVGLSNYNVYRSTTQGFTASSANRIAQPTGTSYTDNALASGTYYYRVTAQDAAGNVGPPSNEASATVTADTTPPTVSITSPPAGTVSGTVNVAANASDNGTVAGVQFKLDGSNLGAEDTGPPYTFTWDTLTATNGAHTLTAVARDAAGNMTTSAPVAVTVSNTAPSGNVAAYAFDESSGNTVVDGSGMANTGTLSNATRVTGKFNSGLHFDGNSSIVTVPDSNSLDLTTGMTLEAWVDPDVADNWETLLFKERSGGDAYALYGASDTGAPEVQVFTGGTSHVAQAQTPLPLNVWSHLAATYDGSNLRLYVNGSQVASTAVTGAITTSTGVLHMGANSVWGERYTGAMDEARIYNRALSAGEIQADMRRSITPDHTPPTVTAKSPAAGTTGVSVGAQVTATFSESMDDTSLSPTSFDIKDGAGNVVPGTVSYDDNTHTATFNLSSALKFGTTYTATLEGGAATPHVTDLAGNPLAADVSWTFTTEAASPPILVVTSRTNDYTLYTGQILRAEGFNEYTSIDASLLSSSFLAPFDVVILGDTSLTAAQVTTLTNWVNGGGHLIALHPDKQLAGLLGLTDAGSTLSNAYLKVNTTVGTPGAGIVGQTIQYHGSADRYNLNGATAVATLYSNATTATANPAVTLRSVGSNGGAAAAFTYDLAKSVILTRQGNPAWEGEDRDGDGHARASDLFYGAMPGDVQPDWIDTSKIAIPQADEQQRLLANLITTMNSNKTPLPHLWYLPFGKKAAVVMTGDDHTGGGTVDRFNTYIAESPPGCSVVNWECVRASSNIVPDINPLTDAQLAPFIPLGFEVADHPTSNCVDWNESTLDGYYTSGLANFAAKFPDIPTPTTGRFHCWLWNQYVTEPKVELAHGIRFDENYSQLGGTWIASKPGFMTGSGEIMRFADTDGTPINVWQAVTQMPDEAPQSEPSYANSLFDNATNANGYYGVFTTLFHTDNASDSDSDAVVGAAQAHSIPVVSAKQMLTWVDGRDGSTMTNFSWNGSIETFQVNAAAGAYGMQAMLPLHAGAKNLTSLTSGGNAVPFTTQTIKGIDYAFFSAVSGTYSATYG